MTKRSLKERIVNFFRGNPNHFISGATIEELALRAGYKASNASRRLRELANDGTLDRQESPAGYVEYRYHQDVS